MCQQDMTIVLILWKTVYSAEKIFLREKGNINILWKFNIYAKPLTVSFNITIQACFIRTRYIDKYFIIVTFEWHEKKHDFIEYHTIDPMDVNRFKWNGLNIGCEYNLYVIYPLILISKVCFNFFKFENVWNVHFLLYLCCLYSIRKGIREHAAWYRLKVQNFQLLLKIDLFTILDPWT